MSQTLQIAPASRAKELYRDVLPHIAGSRYKLEIKPEGVVQLGPKWFASKGCHALYFAPAHNGASVEVVEGIYKDIKEYADERTHYGWAWKNIGVWKQEELAEKLKGKLAKFEQAPPPKFDRLLTGLDEGADIAINGTISLAIVFSIFAGGVHVYETNFKHDNQHITAPTKSDPSPNP